jgi:hypothetical protein
VSLVLHRVRQREVEDAKRERVVVTKAEFEILKKESTRFSLQVASFHDACYRRSRHVLAFICVLMPSSCDNAGCTFFSNDNQALGPHRRRCKKPKPAITVIAPPATSVPSQPASSATIISIVLERPLKQAKPDHAPPEVPSLEDDLLVSLRGRTSVLE